MSKNKNNDGSAEAAQQDTTPAQAVPTAVPAPQETALSGRNMKMADLARRAGVSTATVSRALTRPDRVHPETREIILKLADELGFRPNLIGRQLRNQSSNSLMILVQDLANPFYTELIKGAESVAIERKYSVVVGNTDGRAETERLYADLFLGNRVDGLILLTGHLPEGISPQMARNSPIVLVSELNSGLELSSIGIDNVRWARQAVEMLIRNGHRQIAHLAGPPERIISREREEGYRQALAAAGLPCPETMVACGEFTINEGRVAARRLLAREDRPSAIFCANDESAIGALFAARDLGIDVPSQLSVVGFDDIPLAGFIPPTLTTVRQPRFALGQASASMVIDMIEHGNAGTGGGAGALHGLVQTTMECEIIHRGSVAPAIG